jgi:two-component system, OmpR family, response regulator
MLHSHRPLLEKAAEVEYEFAGWRLDPTIRELRDPEGRPIDLSTGQFALLRVMVERPRRVLSREQLLDLARGPAAEPYDRAIDVQVCRLRRKMAAAAPGSAALIRTFRGEGYMFVGKVALR